MAATLLWNGAHAGLPTWQAGDDTRAIAPPQLARCAQGSRSEQGRDTATGAPLADAMGVAALCQVPDVCSAHIGAIAMMPAARSPPSHSVLQGPGSAAQLEHVSNEVLSHSFTFDVVVGEALELRRRQPPSTVLRVRLSQRLLAQQLRTAAASTARLIAYLWRYAVQVETAWSGMFKEYKRRTLGLTPRNSSPWIIQMLAAWPQHA